METRVDPSFPRVLRPAQRVGAAPTTGAWGEMRRFTIAVFLVSLFVVGSAAAQQRPAPPRRAQTPPPPPPEPEPEVEEEELEEEEPQLRAPDVAPPTLPPLPDDDFEEEELDEESPDAPPGPASAAELMGRAEQQITGQTSDPTLAEWAAPEAVFTLHGYYRLRAHLADSFSLGRSDAPFGYFVPADQLADSNVSGGCGPTPGGTAPCGGAQQLRFANMRLRLQPTLSLSDNVRVHMQVDVLDNVVLGSTPATESWRFNGTEFGRAQRSPTLPVDGYAASQQPPSPYRNSLENSIHVRRAWAEVTNRDLGQLRFGRMGWHWGLGLLTHGGDGIDSDFQTDVDRVMAITKLAGFYFAAAWDWAARGYVTRDEFARMDFVRFDGSRRDDLRQFVFMAARRMGQEEQEARLRAGGWVLNGGFQFVYRSQFLSWAGEHAWDRTFVRTDAQSFTPDLWGQFLWRGLRVEAEAVVNVGSIENIDPQQFVRGNHRVLQFGGALESEYRLVNDRLGISFHTGLASGDREVDGLYAMGQAGTLGGGRAAGDRISTFAFHPNYRVDLILWRTILERVTGAYYFRPGVGYDFIRSPFGQLLGARVDAVYSRATRTAQSWGNNANLGLELDVSLYYRSEDGPDPIDGFHALAQYAVLFPFRGMGAAPVVGADPINLRTAQLIRLLLGVQF